MPRTSKRGKKPNQKYERENVSVSLSQCINSSDDVTVVCNQSGKKLIVKASKLSLEEEDVQMKDIFSGSQLLLEEDGHAYPVTVISDRNKSPTTATPPIAAKRKLEKSSSSEQYKKGRLEDSYSDPELNYEMSESEDEELSSVEEYKKKEETKWAKMVEEAKKRAEFETKQKECSKQKKGEVMRKERHNFLKEDKENIFQKAKFEMSDTQSEHKHSYIRSDSEAPSYFKQFEENVLKRLTTIEKLLRRPNSSESSKAGVGASIKKEEDPRYMYKGTPLLTIVSKDAIAYGRRLLDMIFSKEEQKMSLVHKSSANKSSKPLLDQSKVHLILDCVKIRFPEHDSSKLFASLNQKCRDAKVILID